MYIEVKEREIQMLTYDKQKFDELGQQTTYTIDILLDGEKIGRADVIEYTEDAEYEPVYLEWIQIDEEYRNNGYGTQAIKDIASNYQDDFYFAPLDEDNVRCYERFAELTESYDEIDQGYGVYVIN